MKFVAIAPAFLICMLMLALAGCGRSSNDAAHVQSGSGQPTATSHPQPTPTASAAHSSSGRVTLTLNKSRYAPEEAFFVTIHNGLSRSIWVQDQQSGCTSLSVEHSVGGEWDGIGQCVMARPARTISIAAGASLSQRIDFAQGMDTGGGWPAGAYRVTLTYAMDQQASASTTNIGNTAQSAEFLVQ